MFLFYHSKKTKKTRVTIRDYCWIAQGSPRPGVRKSNTFSIHRWGEEGAKEKAIAQRKQWEKEMDLYEQEINEKGITEETNNGVE